MELLSQPDVIIICVPTPLGPHREPDLRFIKATGEEIAKYLRKDQLVSLESTTYPGTTKEFLLPILEKKGMKAGKDFFVVYSPERIDPGNKKYKFEDVPKIVGGITKRCLAVGVLLYSQIVKKVVPVSSCEVAESAKLVENIYRAVNIALVNELKILFDKMGIDIWEIINAASTKPFGFHPFYPGPGLGGHCIPIDPFYLTWKAKEYDIHTKFIELAGEINTQMPYYVVGKTMEALNKYGKTLKESKILIIGIAYKKDVDDIRESPGIKIMKIFEKKGAKKVDYYDPFVPAVEKSRQIEKPLYSINFTLSTISRYDVIVIVTAHSSIDYKKLYKNAKLIIDTRNVYPSDLPKIVKA